VDPVTSLLVQGNENEVHSMLMALLDYMKGEGITCFFTALNASAERIEQSDVGISSLIDSWLLVRDIEANGERNRGLFILKSRGMAHSNQIREFLLTADGVRLCPTYLGQHGVLTGSARLVQEAKDAAETLARRQEIERRERELERERMLAEARVAAIRSEYEAKAEEIRRAVLELESADQEIALGQDQMAASRKVGAGHDHEARNGILRGKP